MTSDRNLQRTPLEGDEQPAVIANFVTVDGEIIARRSASNLPVPEIGSRVSFGSLSAPTPEQVGTENAEFEMGDITFLVLDVEYTYSEITYEKNSEEYEKTHPNEFVLVTVFIEHLDER